MKKAIKIITTIAALATIIGIAYQFVVDKKTEQTNNVRIEVKDSAKAEIYQQIGDSNTMNINNSTTNK